MKKTLTMLALCAVVPASPMLADDDCFGLMANWQFRDVVMQLGNANGWTVRRIKIDDGCHEIDGIDGDGRRIEVTVDPVTLALIEIENEDRKAYKHHD